MDGYATSSDSLLKDFLTPALARATNYNRAAGYFSSSLFALAPLAYADFVERGGKIRLLCSPHLNAMDAEFFSTRSSDEVSSREVVTNSLTALSGGGELEGALLKVLSSLLNAGVLEMQFVRYREQKLFHDKVGIFIDDENNVMSYLGSANETFAAWSGYDNHENIEVFCSWESHEANRRVQRHREIFEDTWAGLRRGLEVVPIDEAREIITSQVFPEPLEESMALVREVLRGAPTTRKSTKVPKSLRGYQTDALQSWADQGHRGIVSFATGGGKTLTAISAIRDWISEGKPALVLVPSELLHTQWQKELRAELHDSVPILTVGAGSNRNRWLEMLPSYSMDDVDSGPRIIVSTYQSAVTENFLSRLQSGDHLLVVADEVHRLGAPDTRRFMSAVEAGGRLGLSATPERYGDPEGTQSLFDYFGDVVQPQYDLADAIRDKVLVDYDYRIFECALSHDEQESWDDYTKQIAKDFVKNNNALSEYGNHLVRLRANIAKRAQAKAPLARQILEENTAPGDRWLVYCNDTKHLREVAEEIAPLGLQVMEYHSQNDSDHEAILSYFVGRGGVLLAIRCLDEGVDIPAINKALILASSTNPREYIQRRGRVLRRSEGKYSAQIFDVAVVDEDGVPISEGEVKRAREFAENARNSTAALKLADLERRMSAASNTMVLRPDFEDDEISDTGGEGESDSQ